MGVTAASRIDTINTVDNGSKKVSDVILYLNNLEKSDANQLQYFYITIGFIGC